MTNRTALLFGSFNPIHNGHLMLAQYVLNHLVADDVWLVVSPQNPFKAVEGLADANARIQMVRLATAADEHISACDIELSLPIPSYTINTITALEEQNPNRKFIIMMGGDNLAGLPKWREAERLINGREFIVYPRPGETTDTSAVEALGGCVTLLKDAPLLNMSSTMIRHWIACGMSVRHFVPDGAAPMAEEVYKNILV